ncbi:MAG: LPS export ABC transporter permease LptG [Leptospirillia bacterium]
MQVLLRYIAVQHAKTLALVLAGLSVIHLTVRAVEKLRVLLGHEHPAIALIQFVALSLPGAVSVVTPFALLLSTILALGALASRSEIIAMRAAGFGIHRLALPLLGIGLLASLILLWASYALVPKADALAGRILAEASDPRSGSPTFLHDRLWFRTEGNAVFGVASADMQAGVMSGVRILELDGKGRVQRLTTARRMVFGKDGWFLEDGRIAGDDDGGLAVHGFSRRPAPLSRPPGELGNLSVRHEHVSVSDLSRYIRRLEDDGYDATPYRASLASRMAMPFACLVMVLVAIPYGLILPRGKGIARGIATGLAIALCFWLLISMSTALGRSGTLPAVPAAWLPLAIFSAWGAYRLMAVRQ